MAKHLAATEANDAAGILGPSRLAFRIHDDNGVGARAQIRGDFVTNVARPVIRREHLNGNARGAEGDLRHVVRLRAQPLVQQVRDIGDQRTDDLARRSDAKPPRDSHANAAIGPCIQCKPHQRLQA
jgi:hypothetical protein